MRTPEILAPAGDESSLLAALVAGADAVYFGVDEGMNARARATNFPMAKLPEIADRIHRGGAKAYLTMNTVVFEGELPFVESLVRAAAAAGIDALIVQDPATALIARAVAPTLEVHASTQMTISSPEGARFATRLGCTRVVVPRELSVEEIRRFAANTDTELEVFVHGALCMSWSGQCLTSEAWGGRSANRGQCAQSCRLPYDLVVDGQKRDIGDVRYLLSPLDLAGVRAVPHLMDIGVHSLKIEGRLKGPQYVVTAVEGYKRWVEAVAEGRRADPAAQGALQDDLGRMSIAYSRGFSDGFFAGSDHQELVIGDFPKHRGWLLGAIAEVRGDSVRVVRAERAGTGAVGLRAAHAPSGQVAVSLDPIAGARPDDSRGVPLPVPVLSPGMGVGFDLGTPQESEPGGPIFGVETTPDGWWLRFGRPGPDLGRVRPGHRVFLSRDPKLFAEVDRRVAAGEPDGRVPVRLAVSGAAGDALQVVATAGGPIGRGVSVEVRSEQALQPASGRGLDASTLIEKLGGLGGTPLRLVEVDTAALSTDVHLPVSQLKALRRQFAPALVDAVLARARHALTPGSAADQVRAEALALAPRRAWQPPARPTLVPLCRTDAQLDAVIQLGFSEVELDWMELVGLQRAVEKARTNGLWVTIATVRVQKPGEEGYDRRFANLRPDAVLVRHWGGLMAFSSLPDADRPVVHGDFSLNVTNSVTAHHLLALGADTLTASHDLDERQLREMLANVPAERITVALHHHISTFHTEHCTYAHTLSHGRDWRTCGRPCERHQLALRDVNGNDHPVVVDVACRNTVFNAAAQSAASAVPRLVAAGVRRFRVEFVWETGQQARVVLEAYRALLSGTISAEEAVKRVGTHEQFGVTGGTMRTMT